MVHTPIPGQNADSTMCDGSDDRHNQGPRIIREEQCVHSGQKESNCPEVPRKSCLPARITPHTTYGGDEPDTDGEHQKQVRLCRLVPLNPEVSCAERNADGQPFVPGRPTPLAPLVDEEEGHDAGRAASEELQRREPTLVHLHERHGIEESTEAPDEPADQVRLTLAPVGAQIVKQVGHAVQNRSTDSQENTELIHVSPHSYSDDTL